MWLLPLQLNKNNSIAYIQHQKNMDQNGQKLIQNHGSFGFEHVSSRKLVKKTQPKVTLEPRPENLPKLPQRSLNSRRNMEFWEETEIQKIFQLYLTHGSQWKALAQYFPERSANSIKNRFYTVLRNLLKDLFYYNSSLPDRLPSEISSKAILKFYEGKGEFQSMGSFGKKIMAEIGYSVKSSQIYLLSSKYSEQIEKLYKIIFLSSSRKDRPESQDQIDQGLFHHSQPHGQQDQILSQPQDERLSQPRDQRLSERQDQRLPGSQDQRLSEPQDEINQNSPVNRREPIQENEDEQMLRVSGTSAMNIFFYWYPQQYMPNIVFFGSI